MTECWKHFAAAAALAALAGIPWPATAAPSKGCAVPAGQRVVGSITQERWPISQERADGSEVRRTYTVHVPSQHQDPQRPPLPIVLDLHNAFLSGFQQNLDSAMSAKGAEVGFIVAQPDSWPWWATKPIEEALRGGVSDVQYVARLLDTFDQHLCFDSNQIFVVGGKLFGGLGLMATELACASARNEIGHPKRRHKIAAAAVVASFPVPTPKGPPWAPHSSLNDMRKILKICPALSHDPVPLLVIFSDNDLTLATLAASVLSSSSAPRHQTVAESESLRAAIVRLPISRGDASAPSAQSPPEPPVQQAVLRLACYASAVWGQDNGCSLSGLAPFAGCEALVSPTEPSATEAWGGLKTSIEARCGNVPNRRAAVTFMVFGTGSPDRNGHIWPGGALGGDWSATKAIWEFFSQHPRPPS